MEEFADAISRCWIGQRMAGHTRGRSLKLLQLAIQTQGYVHLEYRRSRISPKLCRSRGFLPPYIATEARRPYREGEIPLTAFSGCGCYSTLR